MPGALADFFFIAGLEGNEPAILNAGGHNTSSNGRDDTGKDVSSVQETIKEESASRFHVSSVSTHRRATISNDEYPASSSPAAYRSRQRLSAPASDSSSERETNSDLFEDVMARFASEREDFLSRLGPPPAVSVTRPTPPLRQSSPFLANEDYVSEQYYVDEKTPSPFRPRSILRTKLVDLSRRASRVGNLRRANTIGSWIVYFC
jgi:hypothetical protein